MNDLFTRLGETVQYEGRMVRMSTLHYQSREGETFDRDFVFHPGAVAVLPILDDGSIVLVRQFRSALGRATLELPAGVRDKDGESVAETAARELAEETGYVADSLVELVSIHTAPGFSNEQVTIFVGTGLTMTSTDFDGIEEQHMSTVVVSPADFDELSDSGELTDAKTLLAVHMVRSSGAAGMRSS